MARTAIGVAIGAAFVAAVIWSALSGTAAQCEICVDYKGRKACSIARAGDRLDQLELLLERVLLTAEKNEIVPCILIGEDKKNYPGWIQPNDLELAARLKRVRPRTDNGVLLSPFDPVLWDRRRVRQLFAFDLVLEIFKPAPKRKYGYYCLPVLAGDRLVARVDLKADWKAKKLNVLSVLLEDANPAGTANAEAREAVRTALNRYAGALKLKPAGKKIC